LQDVDVFGLEGGVDSGDVAVGFVEGDVPVLVYLEPDEPLFEVQHFSEHDVITATPCGSRALLLIFGPGK
jgi:hypothetical protein